METWFERAESRGPLQKRLPHVIISKLSPSLVLSFRSILVSEHPVMMSGVINYNRHLLRTSYVLVTHWVVISKVFLSKEQRSWWTYLWRQPGPFSILPALRKRWNSRAHLRTEHTFRPSHMVAIRGTCSRKGSRISVNRISDRLGHCRHTDSSKWCLWEENDEI